MTEFKVAQGNDFVVRFDIERHRYLIDRVGVATRVPSVTQILGVLDKPGMPWWGMKVGVAGGVEVVRGLPFKDLTADEVVKEMTAQKLTVNHQRDKAGSRGTSVHNIAERYAKTGELTDPDTIPPSERGYVEAFFAWNKRYEPLFD